MHAMQHADIQTFRHARLHEAGSRPSGGQAPTRTRGDARARAVQNRRAADVSVSVAVRPLPVRGPPWPVREVKSSLAEPQTFACIG